MNSDEIISIVGLGYVGLPLAVECGKKWHTIGLDRSDKIDNFKRGVDPTGQISTEQFKASSHLELSADISLLATADYILIAVPTPVDIAHNPDFAPLIRRQRNRRQAHEARRDRRLRIDRLSGRDRGSLHPGPGKIFGPEVEGRFPRRLLARAHQPGRQGTHADQRS